MDRRRERKLWWLSLCALPLLLAAVYFTGAWRNIGEFMRRTELSARPIMADQAYAGAVWQVQKVRLIGDGRDANTKLPGQMRILILRLNAMAKEDIGDRWTQCSLTLTDDRGRRWQPVNVILSANIDRQLDPKAPRVDGCNAIAYRPPVAGNTVLMEEKFIVPADAAPSLVARLSFASTRPEAITLPLSLP
ncbi:hypothetical protein KX729_14620 [Rhizobium sp. XQZ8]|uniref:hypothetical protein n=1 Tax=Rhizobium populisoli TaxID=2859785 RepID=UPI001CA4BB32|nr:hypothetical protein [Rhizobium populisoli]MBW6422688.1 hypothetical protein [Rhizobium populisoli]